MSSWVTAVIAKVAEGHLWQSVLPCRLGDAQNKDGVNGMYVCSENRKFTCCTAIRQQ